MIDQRVLRKASLDPYYRSVLKNFGASELKNSGFFDDGTAPTVDMAKALDPNFLVTPLGKIKERLNAYANQKDSSPIAVLISTGGFCPIHDGHIQMMESARSRLEEKGYFVAGGYLTPDHDSYVLQKCGDQAISAEKRLALIESDLQKNDWLAADPSASYLDRNINFTDLIRRLQDYLNRHCEYEIEVFYVCGADNNAFYKAFIEQGRIVIVPRLGQQLHFGEMSEIFIADRHQANSYSSSALREAGIPHSQAFDRKYDSVKIFIRDEGSWAVSEWVEKYGTQIITAKNRLQEKLQGLIHGLFKAEYAGADLEVSVLSVESQQEKLVGLLRHNTLKTISLDPCTSADYNIFISRLFTVSDSFRKKGLYSRPGSGSLQEQIARIPAGEYNLVEDDIATGSTIRQFLKLLPENVKINQVIALNQLSTDQILQTVESDANDRLSDVVDLRDFIVGSKEGGLVVELMDGTLARAPYLLPYVRNTTRMSLPLSREREFSESLWELNYDFFMQTGNLVRIADAAESFRNLAHYLGFSESTKMSDFCRWHIQQLSVRHGNNHVKYERHISG